MATLGPYYCTGSSYCQNRMEYSIERTADGYKVTYNIAFYRTNSYTTSGRTYWGIYIDGNLYQSGNQSISFSNSGWVTLTSGSFTVSLSGWSSTNITLGYETCSSVTTNLTTGGYTHDYLSGSPDHTTSVGINAYYSVCGVPSVNITDNGNNTFTISATAGYSGNNNTANGVTSVEYSFNNYDWYGTSNWGAISISSNQTVYGRAKTDGSYADSDYGYATPISVKYYSKPGTPNIRIVDNDDGTFSISVAKGSDGSNNAATGIANISYSYDNSNWIDYTSPVTLDSSKTVYARARTIGTYTGNSSAWYYSDWAVVSSTITAITACRAPLFNTTPRYISHYTDSLQFNITNAASGTGNTINGYEIQYCESNSIVVLNNWKVLTNISTTDTSYTLTLDDNLYKLLKNTKKRYIGLRVRTLGTAGAKYYSNWIVFTIYIRNTQINVKNSNSFSEYIPYLYIKNDQFPEGKWVQIRFNSAGIISALYDSNGEAVTDSEGNQIYTLEYTN